MKIVSLTASNVKRLQAVEIRPEGNTIVIGGRNGAGKSSVLDSIAAVLGGAKLCPREPIRKGESKAFATVTLDNGMVVTRRWTTSSSTLLVETTDGARYRKPQQILDKFAGELTFDPLDFMRKQARDQQATLQALVGIDFTELDGKRAYAYDERRDANKALKRMKAMLEDMAHHEDVPDAPVSVADLMQELERRQDVNAKHEATRERMVKATQDASCAAAEQAAAVSEYENECSEIEQEIANLRNALEAKRKDVAEAQRRHERAVAEHGKAMATAKKTIDSLQDELTDDVVEQIKGAEDVNRKLAANEQRARQEKSVAALEADAADWAAKIEGYDEEKRKAIESAAFPVDGLGFTEDGVTFGGLPLEQASQAEQLRISVAMGIALNPELRILLVRDGSLLDEENLALMAQMADEADAQIWLERVGEGGASVVIEEGMVAEVDGAEPEQQELVPG